MAGLLSNDQRRRRVWATCVKGSSYSHLEKDFLAGVPKLYEKRWSVVISFISRVKPLLVILRSTWSQADFERGMGPSKTADDFDDSTQFSAAEFTKTLADNMWFAYMHMLLQLHRALESVVSWAEGCSCHGHLLAGRRRGQRAQIIRFEAYLQWVSCSSDPAVPALVIQRSRDPRSLDPAIPRSKLS